MATGDRISRRNLSEAVQEPPPKPALGPPHDVATVGTVLFFAAAMFFTAYSRIDAHPDWMGWVGMFGSLAALVVSFQYFIRPMGSLPEGPFVFLRALGSLLSSRSCLQDG